MDTDPTSSLETGHLSVGHVVNPSLVDLVRLPDTFHGSAGRTLLCWAEEYVRAGGRESGKGLVRSCFSESSSLGQSVVGSSLLVCLVSPGFI